MQSGCANSNQEHQACVPSSGTFHEAGHTTCPVESCSREMARDSSRFDGGYDSLSGLHHVYCPTCQHRGMVPSGDMHILFCAGHQYVLAYGPSLSTVTVVLTASVLAAYQTYALCLDDLAKLVVGWALLSGVPSGTVTLTPGRQEFLDFERYLRGHVLQRSSLRVA